jgi:hypothetical protein
MVYQRLETLKATLKMATSSGSTRFRTWKSVQVEEDKDVQMHSLDKQSVHINDTQLQFQTNMSVTSKQLVKGALGVKFQVCRPIKEGSLQPEGPNSWIIRYRVTLPSKGTKSMETPTPIPPMMKSTSAMKGLIWKTDLTHQETTFRLAHSNRKLYQTGRRTNL